MRRRLNTASPRRRSYARGRPPAQQPRRHRAGNTPAHWILRRSKAEAAEALVQLIDVDPTDANAVRKLQNDVRRYADLVRFMSETIISGRGIGTTSSKKKTAKKSSA